MPNFPQAEADVFSLSLSISSGLAAHAADFPSVDPLPLQTAVSNYSVARSGQTDAKSQSQLATENKQDALETLVAEMKKALKLAEVDTTAEPERLSELGWGPKAPPTPTVAPGQPMNLNPTWQGAGSVSFQWDKPADGGSVRNYILQRRDAAESGEFGNWQLIDLFYDSLITIDNQPRGIDLEYRVIAANAAGQSLPSNTATVVL